MHDPEPTSSQKRRRPIHLGIVNAAVMCIAIFLAAALLSTASSFSQAGGALRSSTDAYIKGEIATSDMRDASANFETQARMFVLTKNPTYLRNYLIEQNDTRRRERAIEDLGDYSDNETAMAYLEGALRESNELMKDERYAMKLVVLACGIPEEKGARELADVEITPQDLALSDEAKLRRAYQLVFNDKYQASLDRIGRLIGECKDELIASTQAEHDEAEANLESLMTRQSLLAILLIAVVAGAIAAHVLLIFRPLRHYTARIDDNKPLELAGAAELQHLANAYNSMYAENTRQKSLLVHEAEHDSLTGLLNRSAYNRLYEEHRACQALAFIDVDLFKHVNDDLGHDVGDQVLKAIGAAMGQALDPDDFACRIGGDEFAVIMAGMSADMRPAVERRVQDLVEAVKLAGEGLPKVTLSIGVAFSEDADAETSLYKAADLALYAAKHSGRNAYAFYADVKPSR